MRSFLVKHCKQGGSCPPWTADGLRYYADTVYTQHRSELKAAVQNKPVALIVDETTDITSRSVLNVIAIVLDPDDSVVKPLLRF